MVNCRKGFERILSRDDLTEEMLIATYRYLLYYEQKNATAILKNKKKLQKLEWHKEKLSEKFSEFESNGMETGAETGAETPVFKEAQVSQVFKDGQVFMKNDHNDVCMKTGDEGMKDEVIC